MKFEREKSEIWGTYAEDIKFSTHNTHERLEKRRKTASNLLYKFEQMDGGAHMTKIKMSQRSNAEINKRQETVKNNDCLHL